MVKGIARFSLRTLVLAVLSFAAGSLLWKNWEPWVVENEITYDGGPACSITYKDRLIIGSMENEGVNVFDAKDWKLICSYKDPSAGNHRVDASRVSPDGRQLLTFGKRYGEIRAIDIATRKELGVVRGHIDLTLAYSPDGRTIASAEKDGLFFTDPNTFSSRSIMPQPQGWEDNIFCVRFSNDSKFVATACRDGTVKVLDVITGGAVASTNGPIANSLQFSPSGDQLAVYVKQLTFGASIVSSSSIETIRVYDARTGDHLFSIQHPGGIEALQYSPDGKSIATSSLDKGLFLWSSGNGRLICQRSLASNAHFIVFSPDGKRIASGEEYGTRIWDTCNLQMLADLEGTFNFENGAGCFSPDGAHLAVGSSSNVLTIWERRRPEWWYGVFALPTFGIAVLLGCSLIISVWRDRKNIR